MPAQRQAAPLLTITLVCYGQLIFTIVRERLPPSACRNLCPPAKIPQRPGLCSHLFTVPHHRFMSYTDVFLSDIEKHTEQACVLTSVSSMEVRMCKHLYRLQFSLRCFGHFDGREAGNRSSSAAWTPSWQPPCRVHIQV